MKHILHPHTAVTAKGDLPSLDLVQIMQAQARLIADLQARVKALETP